ncbi:MAG: type II secretion system GspH family protein [Aliidiomarina sp.]|uniref:type II secretion system protein n=1 Tax=Aliidiomarina sp. TaxID=1872439 RepID=UPI0025BB3A1A|nr:type II secretion system protein [Aliidiomarina sp.]MCH8501232.1 type II secretion system GspH family protein [Aliidiomarina sp.]
MTAKAQNQTNRCQQSQSGFTLIEIIVGIVTLGLSFIILTVIIFPQAQRSAEPVLQIRAAALGQALLDEIMSKGFDQQSSFTGGQLRCGEIDAPQCTAPEDLGPESESREAFNDVDDYHELHLSESLAGALGEDLADRFPNFNYAINVCYSDSFGNCDTTITRFKRVEVTVTTPQGQDFKFTAIRGNY